jgi:phosphonate transport system substrate-binding protein
MKILLFFTFLTILFSNFALSEDCYRGELSSQFCDRDGDMMADSPTNPKKLTDPYTLVFGMVPSQSFVFKKGSKEALRKHIEKVTGKRVEIFPYKTNSAELEAMRSGLLHIAGLNTGSVPTAVNCAGFHLFAMTSNPKQYGYTMQLITYPGSGVKSIKDIKGKTVLFTSSSSNSGHKAPVAIFKEKFNLIEGKDYRSRYSGSHKKSILKVANHEYKVAAVASGFTRILKQDGVIPNNAVKIVYESERFPTTGYGYSHKLKPSLAKKIEEAFFTFRWVENNKTIPFNKFNETKFVPANYKKNWEIIRLIDKANGITYNCK